MNSNSSPLCASAPLREKTLRQGKMARIDGVLTYIPIQGPRIKQIRRRKSNTGVPGISFGTRTRRSRRYDCFFAKTEGRSIAFCITTLGREEAWERALRCRAEYERGVMALNAAIRAQRNLKAKTGKLKEPKKTLLSPTQVSAFTPHPSPLLP